MGPAAEVHRCALVQTTHVDFVSNAVVQLEEDAATPVNERVAVLRNHKVHEVVAVEIAQLRVGLVGSHDVLDSHESESFDQRDVEFWGDLQCLVILTTRLGHISTLFQFLSAGERFIASPRNQQ